MIKYFILLLTLTSCYHEQVTPDQTKESVCAIATMAVHEQSVSFDITSLDSFVSITKPYYGYSLTYTVNESEYDCIGFLRTNESFTVTISDRSEECAFIVPSINKN